MDTYLLDTLYRNETDISHILTVEIKGTKLKGEFCRDRLLEEVGDNKKLLDMLTEIDDAINGLSSLYSKSAFYNGIGFGAKIAEKLIERENNNQTITGKMIENYNRIKELAGYKSEEKVKNYMNVLPLQECTDDEGIQSILRMFHNSKDTYEDIKKTKSDEYIKKYRKLMFLENEFLLEASDSVSEIFTRYVKAEKSHDNYHLLNTYFSGFRVGVQLTKEFDIIFQELQKQNEDIE